MGNVQVIVKIHIPLNILNNIQTIDLKPNGSALPVTDDNKFEYIHLVANYRLNRQVHPLCETGLTDFIM